MEVALKTRDARPFSVSIPMEVIHIFFIFISYDVVFICATFPILEK
jgi:hypothetical protein